MIFSRTSGLWFWGCFKVYEYCTAFCFQNRKYIFRAVSKLGKPGTNAQLMPPVEYLLCRVDRFKVPFFLCRVRVGLNPRQNRPIWSNGRLPYLKEFYTKGNSWGLHFTQHRQYCSPGRVLLGVLLEILRRTQSFPRSRLPQRRTLCSAPHPYPPIEIPRITLQPNRTQRLILKE